MLLIINNWTHFASYKIITIFQSWQTSTNLSLSYTNVPSEFSERDIGRFKRIESNFNALYKNLLLKNLLLRWRLQVNREGYFFRFVMSMRQRKKIESHEESNLQPSVSDSPWGGKMCVIHELCNRPCSLWSPCGSVVECGIGRSEVQFLIGTQIFFLCPTFSLWQDKKTSCSISLLSSKPSLFFNKFKFKVHPHYQNQYQDTLLTCQPAKN